MQKRYIIEKSKILKSYIIWEEHRNYKVMIKMFKRKRECVEYLKKKESKNER